jgi:hypothetical protein
MQFTRDSLRRGKPSSYRAQQEAGKGFIAIRRHFDQVAPVLMSVADDLGGRFRLPPTASSNYNSNLELWALCVDSG